MTSSDPNPVRRLVADIREAEQNRPLPNGGRIRDAGRRRVDALVASAAFSVEDHRRR